MNKRFQTNQRILTALAFHFAIVLMLSSAAIAAELLPNPNDGTIIVNDPVTNSVPFYNNLGGYITNNSTIDNDNTIYNSGTIDSYGTFWNTVLDNSGTFSNYGTFWNVFADLDNSGTFNNESIFYNYGGLTNSGTFNNGLAGNIECDKGFSNTLTGTFNNQGYINSDGFRNDGYIDNSGTLGNWGTATNRGTIDNSGTVSNAYLITNWGTINNQGTINTGAFVNELGGLTINDSVINNNEFYNIGTFINSGIFDNSSGIFANQYPFHTDYGTLKGTGTFIGDLIIDCGTVAPGNSAGTMTIDGDFTLDDLGILDIEIGGFTPGSFDLLDITGTAYLPGGNINFSFLDGYDIVTDVGPGESWELTFLSASFIDSLFDPSFNYNFSSSPYFQFNVFQRGNELVFEAINIVPLPSAVILGVIGLGVAGWKLRKYA